MAKKYSIEQYPKNKTIDVSKLNEYQIKIRKNQKIYVYDKEKTCNTCGKKLPIEEYYIKDSKTGRRANKCRDCSLKSQGVVEIGKQRFAYKIFDKGFRRCSICKEIKPLHMFKKNKSQYGGISNNCYECSKKLHDEFVQKSKSEIGEHYIKEYGKRKGITVFDEITISELKKEIEESRKPKYHLDGESFLTIRDLAKFINEKYNIPITTVEKRISKGASETDCIITESEYRTLKSGRNKGQIKVTDTVTGKKYLFINTYDKRLRKMIGAEAIRKGIETGNPVGGYRNSLWKNPLLIERIPNGFEKTKAGGAFLSSESAQTLNK